MDFYGRAVLVITKFTALQETCSKSSFYYWIWFSRKNRKKSKKKHITGNQLSAFVRFLKNSIVVCFFDRNFWGVIEVSAIFKGYWRIQMPPGFSDQNSSQFLKRILQYLFDRNNSIILLESTYLCLKLSSTYYFLYVIKHERILFALIKGWLLSWTN